MSLSTPHRPLHRRLTLTAGALTLGALLLGAAPHAAASDSRAVGKPIRAGDPVAVTVTHEGEFVTAVCVTDILEGRCQTDIKRGESREFTVKPPTGTPVFVWVVPNGSGRVDLQTEATSSQLCVEIAGSAAEPTVEAIDCV